MPQPNPFFSISTTLYISLLFLHTHFSITNQLSVSPLSSLENTHIGEDRSVNQGELTETLRRVLGIQRRYISYETLKRDVVPCGRPGASYYACNAQQANPYSRGCEIITRCARGL